jgi:hypothetical protein
LWRQAQEESAFDERNERRRITDHSWSSTLVLNSVVGAYWGLFRLVISESFRIIVTCFSEIFLDPLKNEMEKTCLPEVNSKLESVEVNHNSGELD